MAAGIHPQILWDVIDRRITIIAGDRVVDLRQRFRNREDGMQAAEAYCRDHMPRDMDRKRVVG